jgi:hypothetical protein
MSKIKENSGVLIQGHIKIHDPESDKISLINATQFIMRI